MWKINFPVLTERPEPLEGKNMTQTVLDGARSIAQAMGLVAAVDKERVDAFRACQAKLRQIPQLDGEVRALSLRLEAARRAETEGRTEFEGHFPMHRRQTLEHEFSSLGRRLAEARQAESEAVGLCPDGDLQRERREIQATRKATLERLAELKKTREVVTRDVAQATRLSEGDFTPLEKAKQLVVLRDLRRDLAEIDTELTALESDRLKLDADRAELYRKMTTFDA